MDNKQLQRELDRLKKLKEIKDYGLGEHAVMFEETARLNDKMSDIVDMFSGVDVKALKSLKGDKGPQGERGPQGKPGKDGKDGKNGKDGKDGQPGKDGAPGMPADEDVIVASVLERMPEFPEFKTDDAIDIRNKLELLNGDERLSHKAIMGLEEKFEEVNNKIAKAGSKVIYGNGGGGSGGGGSAAPVAFVGASAKKSGTQSVSGLNVEVTFQSESIGYDTDDMHSESSNTHQFTVPSAGFYRINCFLGYSSNNLTHIAVHKNNVSVSLLFNLSGIGGNEGAFIDRTLELEEGDVIHVEAGRSSGSCTLSIDSYCEVYKIGN